MKLNENFIIKRTAAHTALFDRRDTAKIIKLNATSTAILDWVAQGLGEEEILEKILEKYEIGREKASADLTNLLTKWKELGLVE